MKSANRGKQTMYRPEDFLDPRCSRRTLDIAHDRRSILDALRRELPRLRGTLLDIGCGYMPYKPLILAAPSHVTRYIGLDLEANGYARPDLAWDGSRIPLEDASVDCAMATEVFEHCPEPMLVMREAARVLRPGGRLFFTVPFIWPLHDVPFDEYRFTPFALTRQLGAAGFDQISLAARGGWDASLAQMIGLYVRRRPMSKRARAALSTLALPVVRFLLRRDRSPMEFTKNCMMPGLSGAAVRKAA
jgi:SAM-dependent methyltransferase